MGSGNEPVIGGTEDVADVAQQMPRHAHVDGVDWEEGDKVYMVIGIAASADEHVGVLSNLADVIDNEESLADLLKTNDPDTVVRYLGEKQVT